MEKRNTPWGYADQSDPIGDKGILHVSTPSHGGLFVPDELMAQMPEELRGSNSYSGQGNWFEEDVEWAIPVIAFPGEFPTKHCRAAVDTVEAYSNKGPGEYFHSVVKWLQAQPADSGIWVRVTV